jgi:Ca2+-binding EF-hand superfamily protein
MKLMTSIPAGLLVIVLNSLVPATAQADEMSLHGPVRYDSFDSDGNGFVSEEEFTAMQRERMVARMTEMRARCDASSARMFSWLDTNNDGRLSREELAAGPGSRIGRQRPPGMDYGPGMGSGMRMLRNQPDFSVFDLDTDGKITEEEFYTARNNRIKERMAQGYRMRNLPNAPTFRDLDTDGNREISTEEFAAHQIMGHRRRIP